MRTVRTRKYINSGLIWMAVFIAVLLFYYLFDPLETGWMPQCVFYKLTGWQCMGCGSQRMAHALLHGDIAGAWRANAFMLCMLPFLGLLVIAEIRRKSRPALYRSLHSLWVIITLSAMLLAWLTVRNILGI